MRYDPSRLKARFQAKQSAAAHEAHDLEMVCIGQLFLREGRPRYDAAVFLDGNTLRIVPSCGSERSSPFTFMMILPFHGAAYVFAAKNAPVYHCGKTGALNFD